MPPPRLVTADAATCFIVQAEVTAGLADPDIGDAGPNHERGGFSVMRMADGHYVMIPTSLFRASPTIYAHAVYSQARQTAKPHSDLQAAPNSRHTAAARAGALCHAV
jgi:hypothetical protein